MERIEGETLAALGAVGKVLDAPEILRFLDDSADALYGADRPTAARS